jgi:hypothetical protein
LNLQLPESAASHAVLEFSGPVEMQKLPDGAVDRQTRDERGVRKVEFVGISGAATISWREVSPPVAVKPVVQVQNRMKLDLTTIPASLTGTLDLEVTGSPLSEVEITWPEGFEMTEVQARNGSRSSVMDHFEHGREVGSRETKISLTSAAEGDLTIEYDLELSNRSFPQDIRVSLPLVRDANVQTGDVELIFPAGMLVQQQEISGAQRRRVTAETDAGRCGDGISFAFEGIFYTASFGGDGCSVCGDDGARDSAAGQLCVIHGSGACERVARSTS